MSKYIQCPCDSKLLYHKCCKQYHDGAAAETAERLMRSRYSAYALGLANYIMDTTHPENSAYSTDRSSWKAHIDEFSKGTQFVGLSVLEFDEDGDVAYVVFHAHLKQAGEDASFSERSKFFRVDGRWLYHSGDLSAEISR